MDERASRERPPRVLFLTRSLRQGGAERQLVALAAGLRRLGWDVTVACFYAGGAFERDLARASVPMVDLRKRGRWDIFGFLWRLLRLYRSANADIVHGYMPVANMLTLPARMMHRHTRVVWGVRASIMDRSEWLSRLTFWLSCKLARFADCVIANSTAGAADHAGVGYPESRITVISNGIDTQRFRFDAANRSSMREAWGIPDGSVLVGVVGRLHPMKDHTTFMRAAALLASRDAGWRFACIGGGVSEAYVRSLKSEGASLGLGDALVWIGPREDMGAVYSALDIAVSSSCDGEGFANVVAEAMSCGRPCVVTDVGDSACIVGKSGTVVSPKNPEALCQGIERMRERLREEGDALGAVARARIVERFSVASLVEQTAATLQVVYRGGQLASEVAS